MHFMEISGHKVNVMPYWKRCYNHGRKKIMCVCLTFWFQMSNIDSYLISSYIRLQIVKVLRLPVVSLPSKPHPLFYNKRTVNVLLFNIRLRKNQFPHVTSDLSPCLSVSEWFLKVSLSMFPQVLSNTTVKAMLWCHP